MKISNVGALNQVPQSLPVEKAERGFARTLTEAVGQINKMQIDSANSGTELATGSASSLHRVVLEAEEASLSLQLMVAVRNKAMEAYQEVMRMQV